MGERQGIAPKGVRPIDARNSHLKSAAKTSVPPGLLTNECAHPFVCYSGAG